MAPTNWICIRCGITNPKNFFKCQTCQEPKPIFWECSCRRKNPTGALKCAGCRKHRPAIYGATVAMKGLSKMKFSLETNRTSENENSDACVSMPSDSSGSMIESPVSSSFQASPASTLSALAPVGSTLSGKYPSALTKSTLEYNVSYYDIFKKLSQPSRTTRQITYVEDDTKYKQIVANCSQNNTTFIDPQFPPTSKTLFYEPSKYKLLVEADKSAKVYWLRHCHTKPIDKASRNLSWCVIRDPVVSDITQGILGNCWLLTALAVLVERPNILDKILIVKELSERGAYSVRLYRDGKLTSVIIDDYFPCNGKRYHIYSTAKRKQLFVSIIEKAMAKLYGCYESLVSGQVIEGLATLTGFPCRSIRIRNANSDKSDANHTNKGSDDDPCFDPDFLWTMLLSYYTAGFLMGAACGDVQQGKEEAPQQASASDTEYSRMGLLNHHAYSIVNVVHVEGADLRLIRLRNPWGTQVWKGDWSDESTLWTPELKEQLKPEAACEGIFWISFVDFQRYFEKVDICKIRDGWNEARFEGYFPKDSKDYRFNCLFQLLVEEVGTEVELTLHQDSRRAMYLRGTPLIPIGMAVFQMQDLQWKVAGDYVDTSGYKMREFVGCDLMLDKGLYLVAVYAFNHWFKSSDNASSGTTTTPENTKQQQQQQSVRNLRPRYILSAHTSRDVQISAFCTSPAIIGDSLMEIVLAKGRKKDHNENVTSYYVHENWSGLMVVIENRNKSSYLDVLFDASESLNLGATRGALLTQDTIPPMSRQLINILSQLDPNTSYYLSYQLSYRVSTQSTSVHNPEISNVRSLHSPRPFKQISEQQARKPPSVVMGGIEQQLKAMIEQQKKAGMLGQPPVIRPATSKQQSQPQQEPHQQEPQPQPPLQKSQEESQAQAQPSQPQQQSQEESRKQPQLEEVQLQPKSSPVDDGLTQLKPSTSPSPFSSNLNKKDKPQQATSSSVSSTVAKISPTPISSAMLQASPTPVSPIMMTRGSPRQISPLSLPKSLSFAMEGQEKQQLPHQSQKNQIAQKLYRHRQQQQQQQPQQQQLLLQPQQQPQSHQVQVQQRQSANAQQQQGNPMAVTVPNQQKMTPQQQYAYQQQRLQQQMARMTPQERQQYIYQQQQQWQQKLARLTPEQKVAYRQQQMLLMKSYGQQGQNQSQQYSPQQQQPPPPPPPPHH